MFYKFSFEKMAKLNPFKLDSFFATKLVPTRRQVLKYFKTATLENDVDLVPLVIQGLECQQCDFPSGTKPVTSGKTFDKKGQEYLMILERIDVTPLIEKDDA